MRRLGRELLSQTSLDLTVASVDVASLNDGVGTTLGGYTVTGAAIGDFVDVSMGVDTQGILLFAWVDSANSVKVRLQNETGGTIDLASTFLYLRVRPR
jgi:hypothetical protein